MNNKLAFIHRWAYLFNHINKEPHYLGYDIPQNTIRKPHPKTNELHNLHNHNPFFDVWKYKVTIRAWSLSSNLNHITK